MSEIEEVPLELEQQTTLLGNVASGIIESFRQQERGFTARIHIGAILVIRESAENGPNVSIITLKPSQIEYLQEHPVLLSGETPLSELFEALHAS